MSEKINSLVEELENLKNPERSLISQKFFKTGKGEYGEGDIFYGISVPEQRKLAKKYIEITLGEIQILLDSKIHEFRFTGLIILVYKYNRFKKDVHKKEEIFNFYLKNINNINNWDLVDVTCRQIIGDYLQDKNKDLLIKLATSLNLWEKRIAIISTFAFIKNNDFSYTLKIIEILIKDKHDLIHKANGWMLREVGKRNKEMLIDFLDKTYEFLPRTTLRYAIERLNKEEKEYYMNKKTKLK